MIVIIAIISILSRCAKIVSPTGGPKDTIAPILVKSIPAMNSVSFKGDKISLTFDEFVLLKDIQKKLAISPPMTQKPEIFHRGKSIEIKLKEPLKENTTYSIYFADAIKDNNEENPFRNFVFAFSTGITIDSLAITGKVINAFTLAPEENFFVMLYDEQDDSLPLKALPRYLTRTDKKGFFTISHLQSKDYKVFALNDNNSNYKFDQVSEDIAFRNEKLSKEQLINPSQLDTSKLAKREIYLETFKETDKTQALSGFSRTLKNRLVLSFTKKHEGSISLKPLDFQVDSSWFIEEYNQSQDSISYWITNDPIIAKDTLKIQITYQKTDSLLKLQSVIDTLKFIFTEKEEPRKRKNKKEDEIIKRSFLKISSNVRNDQIVSPTTQFALSFSEPLNSINYKLITVSRHKDSSKVDGIKLYKDTLNPRIYRMEYPWEPDINYNLDILPDAFKSLSGIGNDTLKIKFKGANPENFGILYITLLNVKNAAVVELMTENKGRVIEYKTGKNGEKVSFTYIAPGKYTLRFIEDTNENGKWDTGSYLKNIQPERIFFYNEIKTKGVLNIRPNWENEIKFDFTK